MIYLQLFFNFFIIGLVSFGGGYAMIPLIKEIVINNEWLTQEQILNYIAVSESTPGPIAINIATLVGSSQGGILGSILATIGVVLPSFVIILLISICFKTIIQKKPISAMLDAIKPAFIGLIIATGMTMILSHVFALNSIKSDVSIDWISLIIFAVIIIISAIYKKLRKKPISPIFTIIIGGILGLVCYGLV